jgi:cytoskeletal protein RodZ
MGIVAQPPARGGIFGSLECDFVDDRDLEHLSNDAVGDATGFESVGDRLRAERDKSGLTLSEIAARTRVPIRHLEAIEAGEYSALPGSTYTLGFTRSYAKTLGLNENAIVADMREELAQGGFHGAVARAPAYEPADPARVPSRWMAWTAAAVAALVLAAYFVWRSFALSPDPGIGEAAKAVAEAPIKGGKDTVTTAPAPSGEVVITATDTVWVKIYDAEKKRLYENEMKAGDSFTVPADANNPMIVTGRPQVLNVTIGGTAVAPLGTGETSIADVGVSAAALLGRKPEVPVAATAGAGTGTGTGKTANR